ncbi:MAG TPA: ATP synthase F1 subunit epsilon [Prolixibacteraceae bacterium]|nr:ATP synthase F1 subunit epsilon [Prolixibacteraceae bacterium]
MNLEILTPGQLVYSGEVTLVQLPGTKGNFEILNNHAPLISTLEKGKIRIIDIKKQELYFEISGGVIECRQNKIVILVDAVK